MKVRKKRVGRPQSAFPAEKRNALLRLMRSGQTPLDAMTMVGVKEGTVYSRCRRYPEFKKKFETAREGSLDALENQLHQMGRKGNIVAIFGTLKANRPEKWTEKRNLDLSNKDGTLKSTINTFVTYEADRGLPKSLREDGETAH